MEETDTSYHAPRRRKSRKWLWVALITGLIAILIGGGVYWFVLRQTDPIPKDIREKAVFTLYNLPKGYTIDKNSFKYIDRRASYTISSPNQPKMLVTIQPKPAAYNLSDFENKLPGKIGVLTPYGTAAIGVSGETKIATLTAGDNWVLITTSSKVSDQTMKQIISSLKQSD